MSLSVKKATQYDPILVQPGRVYMKIWFHQSMNQSITAKSDDTLYDFKWQDSLSRMEICFQRENFLTHGLKNTGNKNISGSTSALKNPGISTDYLMSVIYVKEFRNQCGVAACKAATNTTDDWLGITKFFKGAKAAPLKMQSKM